MSHLTMVKRFFHLKMAMSMLVVILVSVTNSPGTDAKSNKDFKGSKITSEFIFMEAEFEQCHASTIVELPNGDLLAAWFGGKHEGHESVAIWGSRCQSGTWSSPTVLASELRVPCWNPVLFFDPAGKIWLFYKVGPSPREWSGAYRISTDGGKAWSDISYLPAGLLGPVKNKPIVLANGTIVCGTSVESYRAWSCWVESSTDSGRTWNKYGPITVPGENYGIIQPTLWEMKPGHLKMLVRARNIGFICQATSTDGGHSWSPARPTALPHPNSGIDAVKTKDGTIALVYNHTQKGRTPLNIAFSQDEGETWSQPLVLEEQPGEFSYPAVIQAKDGNLHITYTWKRKRIKHVIVLR